MLYLAYVVAISVWLYFTFRRNKYGSRIGACLILQLLLREIVDCGYYIMPV